MTENLSEQLAEYRANWRVRVPADQQALMDRHVAHLAATGIDCSAKQVGDRAPAIRLQEDADGREGAAKFLLRWDRMAR